MEWKYYWKEKAKSLQHQDIAKEFEASQIIGESYYADLDNQAIYNEYILSLCHTTTVNAWDKTQEQVRTESYTKVIQSSREPFSDFYKD